METDFKVRSRGIIIHEEKLLVVRHKETDDYYALPGGHLDWGEEPADGMRREAVEELGVEPEVGKLLFVHTYIDKDKTLPVEFFFEIKNSEEYLEAPTDAATHSHELAEVRWVGRDEDFNLWPKSVASRFREGTIFTETVEFIRG